MKLKYTKEYTISFRVCYHEEHEGGMDYGAYGDPVFTLEDAVERWERAKVESPKRNWEIVADVESKVTP